MLQVWVDHCISDGAKKKLVLSLSWCPWFSRLWEVGSRVSAASSTMFRHLPTFLAENWHLKAQQPFFLHLHIYKQNMSQADLKCT